MGEARDVLDRMTAATTKGDLEAMAALYAADAVAVTPELGEIKGREEIVEYLKGFDDAFSDIVYEPVAAYEAGNVAVDEGYFTGTNTGELPMPTRDLLPATGKSIRLRVCDIATVENGLIVAHHFYYDQMEFLSQLGLLPDLT